MSSEPDPIDDRLDGLVDLVVQLASGELDTRMAPSPRADPVDAVIVGINMLAEELQALYGGLEARVAERTEALEQAQRQLERLALYDPLTGLANRTLLADRMDQALARGRRSGLCPAVLVLDLDGFKAVNDTYGHTVGDAVLVEVARRLRTIARGTDTVARLGGDEFAVVVGDAEESEVLDVAERVRVAVANPVLAGLDESGLNGNGVTYQVDTSVGVCFAEAGQSAGALLRNADMAMYSAKASSGNGVQVYRPSMRTAALSRGRIADELHTAVVADQLELHYQPLVELASGTIVGVEALVRWNHPVRGAIAPDDFIPAAEETGMIADVGRWVTEHALAQVECWRAGPLGDAPFRLHVNTSPLQLRSPTFVPDVLAAVARHHLKTSDLWLEITETEMLPDDVRTTQTFERLRSAGIRMVMDDFGTGYASIGWVRRLPVDVIKVDRTLVTRLDSDAQQHSVAAAVLALVDAVGLEAVAEGVETEAESAALQALGYRYAQGYFYGKPVAADETTALLRNTVRIGENWETRGVVEAGAHRAARAERGVAGTS